MSDDAEAAKAEGNAHFAAKRYQDAITSYSRAISLDDTKRAYYSNRSGAYLAISDPSAALEDAKKCVALDGSWAKGHSRKGAALYAKRLFSQASTAFAKAHELDGSKGYGEQAEQADLEKKYQSGETERPAGSATPPAPGGGAAAAGAAAASAFGAKRLALFGLRAFVLVNALLYLIPLPGLGPFANGCYRRALFSAAAGYAVQVFDTLPDGRPKMTAAYFGPILQEWRTHYLVLSILFASAGQPSVLFLFPIVLSELGHLGDVGYSLLARFSPNGLASTASGLVSKALPTLVRKDAAEWSAASTATKWSLYNGRVLELQAQAEVLIGVWLIFECFLTRANLMVLGIYWQSMRLRYMSSPQVQVAFRGLDALIRPKISLVPVVGWVYAKITKAMGNMVDPQKQRARHAAGSKCSVM